MRGGEGEQGTGSFTDPKLQQKILNNNLAIPHILGAHIVAVPTHAGSLNKYPGIHWALCMGPSFSGLTDLSDNRKIESY